MRPKPYSDRFLDADTATIRKQRLHYFADQIADINRIDWQLRTIFVLSMQCIEHWLLALQRRLDVKLPKDCRGLETIVNDAVKRALYEEHRRVPAEQTKDELVAAIASTLEIDWLTEISESFRLFHQDVLAYIQKQVN